MDRMNSQHATQETWTEGDAIRAARGSALARASVKQDSKRRRQILTSAVELDVIPELLARLGAPESAAVVVTPVHVEKLTTLVLAPDEPAALSFIAAMQELGAGPEALYLDLLAPTARRLGEMWEDDTCDFTEVTIGLWRLQNAMRELSPQFLNGTVIDPAAPRIVLVPLPGEQHTFGLSMVYDFFRRAGWNAWTGPIDTSGELATIVRRQHVDVLGFSLACDERLADVKSEIAAVRQASKNQGIAIMVGGPGFTANPALAASVGADATAIDGRDAVAKATSLLTHESARR